MLKKFIDKDKKLGLKGIDEYSGNKLKRSQIKKLHFVKVMFGNVSRAGNEEFEYKIGEVTEASSWNPSDLRPGMSGGFNISIEEKIIRWIIRGDTIYDIKIPEDAEVIDCASPSCPHGVFLSNKIIVENPRKVTDDIAMELYKKSDLPETSYFKVLASCAVRGYIETAKQIIRDKVNDDNIDVAIQEFEDYITPKNEIFENLELSESCKLIYEMLYVKQKNRSVYDFLEKIDGMNLYKGLSNQLVEELKKECKEKLDVELPKDYLDFIKYTNGIYINGITFLSKYNEEIKEKRPRSSIKTVDIIGFNENYRALADIDKFIILGKDSTSFFVYNNLNDEYYILSNGTLDIIKEYQIFSNMLEEIVTGKIYD